MWQSNPPSSGPTIVAAFIPLSDTFAKSFEQGAQLAQTSSTTPGFDLKFLDSTSGKSPDAPDLKSLVEKDKAPAVLYWTSDDISSVAPFLTSSQAVGIVAGEVTKKVIRLGASIFGFGFSEELTFKQLAKFAGNTMKSYRFAVITDQQPRYELQSQVFIEESKSLGNTIVFEEKAAAETMNFESLIERAVKEKCDTVVALLPAQAAVKFVRATHARQYQGKIIIGGSLASSDFTSMGSDAEGIYTVQAWSDDSNLKSLYSAKYSNTPDGISLGFAALGYDTVKCLQNISGPLDASAIKYSFLSTPCEGLTGSTLFTGERIAQRRKKILTVKGGQLVPAE